MVAWLRGVSMIIAKGYWHREEYKDDLSEPLIRCLQEPIGSAY
jgi:hypothetical protein